MGICVQCCARSAYHHPYSIQPNPLRTPCISGCSLQRPPDPQTGNRADLESYHHVCTYQVVESNHSASTVSVMAPVQYNYGVYSRYIFLIKKG